MRVTSVMVLADQPLRVVVPGGQAELLGEGLEVLVVVAALAGGVLDAAGVGQGVGGLVQQGAQDLIRGAAQSFAADHDLGVLLAVDVPPAGGVVAPAGMLAVGAAGDDDDGRGDVRVPAADLQPDIFQHLQDRAGSLESAAVRGPGTGPGVPGLIVVGEGGPAGAVEPVVAAAPVRVGEGVVGFGDLPEPLSGVRAVVDVRVILLGELAVGRLDLRRGGAGVDAEQLVVVGRRGGGHSHHLRGSS